MKCIDVLLRYNELSKQNNKVQRYLLKRYLKKKKPALVTSIDSGYPLSVTQQHIFF